MIPFPTELIPDYIRAIRPYVPGKPIEEAERELGMRVIKLASNENPLGPSPLAVKAARAELAGSNRYPDGGGYYLRTALAKLHNLPEKQIALGCGSSDLIDLASRVFVRAGDEGIVSHGTFPLYEIAIRGVGASPVETPLRNFSYDLAAMAAAVTSRTRIIYLANPNNPSGTMFTAEEFAHFMEDIPESVLVVLDEAYFEYVERSDYSRSLDAVREGQNILVLRTFSKVYGLAGMRIGYGMGPAKLIEQIDKIRLPFNTSDVAQAAAVAALDDHEHVRLSIESNRAGLKQLESGLAEMGVSYVPSVANFILVNLTADPAEVTTQFLQRGVIVRPMGWMGLPEAIRVTVGTAEENNLFLRAFEDLLTEGKTAARTTAAAQTVEGQSRR
jgi:histidinol-phosphate aminotransferase